MKTLRWMTGCWLALMLAFAASGAHARAALLIEPERVELKRVDGKASTAKQVHDAILAGAQSHSWTTVSEGPGTIQLSYTRRGKNTAVVRVDFDAHSYQVHYVSSERLKYRTVEGKGRFIHPLYNRWVRNLQAAITVPGELEPVKALNANGGDDKDDQDDDV